MSMQPNPSITGTAVIGALGERPTDADPDRARLDTEELNELIRAEWHAQPPAVNDVATVVTEPVPVPHGRSLLDRILRR